MECDIDNGKLRRTVKAPQQRVLAAIGENGLYQNRDTPLLYM